LLKTYIYNRWTTDQDRGQETNKRRKKRKRKRRKKYIDKTNTKIVIRSVREETVNEVGVAIIKEKKINSQIRVLWHISHKEDKMKCQCKKHTSAVEDVNKSHSV
jgi:hypothetical protein